MGRIASNFFISLDGIVESPEKWHFRYFDDEMGAATAQGTATCDAFLLGRVQYEEWAAYWPNHSDRRPDGEPVEAADDFAGFINEVPKYVVSNSLTRTTWANTTIVSGDVASQLEDLKARTARDIGVAGSITLVRWLLGAGLLDELRLMMHPIVVGHGRRLFEDSTTHRLRLVRHEVFSTGVVDLTYVPARDMG